MILCFDIETTGLPIRKRGFGNYHPPQELKYYKDCRIVELVWALFDAAGVPHEAGGGLIKSDKWIIPAEATSLHKITTNQCDEEGQPISSALQVFAAILAKADSVLGHNIAFDIHVTASEMYRAGMSKLASNLYAKKRIDTMDAAREPLAIKFARRFPDSDFSPHRAQQDVEASASLYFNKIVKLSLPNPIPDADEVVTTIIPKRIVINALAKNATTARAPADNMDSFIDQLLDSWTI